MLEKNLDVCNETSGRNSAVVHGGFANPIGSLKAKCCVEGNRIDVYKRQKQGISGTYSNLSVRLLAVWVCIEEISSAL